MKSGLSHDELAQICAVLETVPSVEKAVLFGSRAMGLARSNSDVDIMLYGNGLTMQDVMQISGLLDETTLPYQFDLIRNDVKNPALLEHVRRYGKVIFQRGKNLSGNGSTSERQTIKLGDVLTFQRGHDLPKTKMIHGAYPVVGSNGIIGHHNEYTTEAPSITVGRSGNTGNPFIVYGRSWSHNTTLLVCERI